MASKSQMTGMLGVYLAAAELTDRGFIVSPTSRSAVGADLLVTDQQCQNAWSVQVKTNRRPAHRWLVNKDVKELVSDSHIYIFIHLRGKERPDYVVATSRSVAKHSEFSGNWPVIFKDKIVSGTEGWEIFFRSQ